MNYRLDDWQQPGANHGFWSGVEWGIGISSYGYQRGELIFVAKSQVCPNLTRSGDLNPEIRPWLVYWLQWSVIKTVKRPNPVQQTIGVHRIFVTGCICRHSQDWKYKEGEKCWYEPFSLPLLLCCPILWWTSGKTARSLENACPTWALYKSTFTLPYLTLPLEAASS